MRPFKKLQENSLYWRYKFITRHWLALRRRARTLRQPPLRPVTHRGATLWVAQTAPVGWRSRGLAFAVVTAAALTALRLVLGGVVAGLAMSLLEIAVVVALVYAFTRSS